MEKDKFEYVYEKFNDVIYKNCYREAIICTQQLKEIAYKTNDIKHKINYLEANSTMNILFSNYYKAVEETSEALILSIDCKWDYKIVKYYNRLGFIFFYLEFFDKALESFNNGLLYCSKEKNEIIYAIIMNNLSNLYIVKNENAKVKNYLDCASEVFRRFGDIISYGHVLSSYGKYYINIGDYDNAFKSLNESLAYFKDKRFKKGMIKVDMDLGRLYFLQKKYQKALNFYLRAYNYLVKAKIIIEQVKVLKGISDCYLALGEYKKSFEFLKLYNYRYNKDKQEKKKIFLADIISKYEEKCKEKEVKFLKEKREEMEEFLKEKQKIFNKIKKAQEKLVKIKQKNIILELASKMTEEIVTATDKISKANNNLVKIFAENRSFDNYLKKISNSCERMNNIVLNYNNLDEIRYTNYSVNTKMIDLIESNYGK